VHKQHHSVANMYDSDLASRPSLTAAADAEALVRRNVPIYLPHLVRLSEEAARVLATCNYGISLPALTVLPPSVASALVAHKWPLALLGMKVFPRATGDALAEHIGPLRINVRGIVRLRSEGLARRLAAADEDARVAVGNSPEEDEDDGGEDPGWSAEHQCDDNTGGARDDEETAVQLFSELRAVTSVVAEALARGRLGVSLPALRCLTPEVAAALVSGDGLLHLEGLASGRTKMGQAALSLVATHLGHLIVGDEEAVEKLYARTHHPDLLGVLIESLSWLREKKADPEERGSGIHEFCFRQPSLSLAEARAVSRVGDMGRVWLYVDAGVSPECARVCAESRGCVFLNPYELVDVQLAQKLADQMATDGYGAESFPFRHVSPDAASVIVSGLNEGQCSLSLSELSVLDPAVAVQLSAIEGDLALGGLVAISTEAAQALVERGPLTYPWERTLSFDKLQSLSPAVAQHLCSWNGDLDFRAIPFFTDEVLLILSERSAHKVTINKSTLAYCGAVVRGVLQSSSQISIVDN
jgi:hypothetical protein